MIKILYFARLKESLKYSTEDLELPQSVRSVAELKTFLARRGDGWAAQFAENQPVRAAINHALVHNQALIKDGDEVAFFPPVTGG
jgi:sulfur-carrier protein